jgi:pre-mRNA-processing factor 6
MDVKIMFSSAGTKAKEKAKVDYNELPIPKGYVAGLGRGVTGFVTRSDIGPGTYAMGDGDEGKDDLENPFDEFMGNDAGVFAQSGNYDEDDREADAIWDAVDEYIDQRRRNNRENFLKAELNQIQENNPKITEQFAYLKRDLAKVSYEEWYAIPEIGNHKIKKINQIRSSKPNSNELFSIKKVFILNQ